VVRRGRAWEEDGECRAREMYDWEELEGSGVAYVCVLVRVMRISVVV